MADRRTLSSNSFSCLPSHFKSKVLLLWVKQCTTLYSNASLKILREVCQLIAFSRPLFSTCSKTVLIQFDPIDLQRVSTPYRKVGITTKYDVPGECVCVSDSQVFMCGGKTRREKASAETFVIEAEHSQQISDMYQGKYMHGLYYDEETMGVYAFGGSFTYEKATATCQWFNFMSASWSPLPNMIAPKAKVMTCGWKGKVFLCGEWSRLCEVFIIATSQFVITPLQTVAFELLCIAVTWKNELIFIGKKEVRKWNASTYQLIAASKYDCSEVCSKNTLLKDGLLLILTEDRAKCVSFELETMNFRAVHSQFR